MNQDIRKNIVRELVLEAAQTYELYDPEDRSSALTAGDVAAVLTGLIKKGVLSIVIKGPDFTVELARVDD